MCTDTGTSKIGCREWEFSVYFLFRFRDSGRLNKTGFCNVAI